MFAQSDAEPLEATFELNDTLYAKAHIPPTNEVYLWLGVSYSAPKFSHVKLNDLGERHACIYAI